MHFLHGLRDRCSRRPHCQRELQTWRHNRTLIDFYTEGIVWVVGRALHWLMWFTLPQLTFTLLPENRRDCFTEWYVFGVLIASAFFYYASVLIYYLAPDVAWPIWLTFFLAVFSAYFSVSTLIVLLHIVLLQRAFGPIKSAERSLLLLICNVVQIVFMFATWYHWGGEPKPLLTSVLTLATIGYAKTMPSWVVITQIATNFLLLTMFLGFLLSGFGAKNGSK
jgi:hypothetical protein